MRWRAQLAGWLFACLGVSGAAHANDQALLPIKIISFVDDATKLDYKGPITEQYVKLNDTIMARAKLAPSIKLGTIDEARAIFSRGAVDIHFPGICEVGRQRAVSYSQPVLEFDRHLIALSDQPVPESLESIRGKRLGLVHRFIYQLPSETELAAMDIQVSYAKSIAASVRMLLNGRVDVTLAPREAVALVEQRLGLNQKLSISSKPHSSNSLCYVAHNTPRGNMLMSRIDKALDTLRDSGELAALLPEGSRVVER